MTPPSGEPLRWRRSPDSPITVSAAAFARLVAENDLKPIEVDGYLWAWLPTEDGYDTYRAYGPKWKYLYQARRVNTQTNAGGGALATRIQLAAGQTAVLKAAYFEGPATSTTLTAYRQDEDGAAVSAWAVVGAGVSRAVYLPTIGTAAAHANMVTTEEAMLGPGEILKVAAAASAQNETLTVALVLLLSTDTEPTWDTTGSAGTPSLAASTISTANTMQAVLLP